MSPIAVHEYTQRIRVGRAVAGISVPGQSVSFNFVPWGLAVGRPCGSAMWSAGEINSRQLRTITASLEQQIGDVQSQMVDANKRMVNHK
jgi:hypothetical protein